MLSWFRRKPLFHAESVALNYSNLGVAERWWADVLGCKRVELPDWDDPLPSDVAMRFAGSEEPSILLSDRLEVEQAGYERPNQRHMIWTSNLDNALQELQGRGASSGEIQTGRVRFFELRDPEGNVLELCEDA